MTGKKFYSVFLSSAVLSKVKCIFVAHLHGLRSVKLSLAGFLSPISCSCLLKLDSLIGVGVCGGFWGFFAFVFFFAFFFANWIHVFIFKCNQIKCTEYLLDPKCSQSAKPCLVGEVCFQLELQRLTELTLASGASSAEHQPCLSLLSSSKVIVPFCCCCCCCQTVAVMWKKSGCLTETKIHWHSGNAVFEWNAKT